MAIRVSFSSTKCVRSRPSPFDSSRETAYLYSLIYSFTVGRMLECLRPPLPRTMMFIVVTVFLEMIHFTFPEMIQFTFLEMIQFTFRETTCFVPMEMIRSTSISRKDTPLTRLLILLSRKRFLSLPMEQR